MPQQKKNQPIKTISGLLKTQLITPDQAPKLEKVSEFFSTLIPTDLLENPATLLENPAIKKQFVPSPEELNIQPHEQFDPISDLKFSPLTGLVHRYPDRVLMMPTRMCAVHCRFCFRKQHIGPQNNHLNLNPESLEKIYGYLTQHPEIWEVILTGGDPLMLNPKHLQKILAKLAEIPHIQVIRIHTRVPVVAPSRISQNFLEILETINLKKSIYLLIHINHASELSESVKKICQALRKTGLSLLSQTVLLKTINDSPEILAELFRTLVINHIKPYYLHHLDLVPGTSHFRVSIKTGQKIFKKLRNYYSGLCLPAYVLDIPGGYGKIPIETCFIEPRAPSSNNLADPTQQYQEYILTNYQAQTIIYADPAIDSPDSNPDA